MTESKSLFTGRIFKSALLCAMSLLLLIPRPVNAQDTVVEATSFEAVTSHLDPGGSLYAYLSLQHWLSGLSGKLDHFREMISEAGEMEGDDIEPLNQVFDVIKDVVERTRIESVTGVGISGIAIGDGLHRTKFFVHRNPESDAGGIWSLAGTESHVLTQLDWLPADTVWAQFTDLNPGVLWNGINDLAREHELDEVVERLDQFRSQFQNVSGTSIDEVIASLGGEFGGILTLSRNSTIPLPNPDGLEIEIPEPGIVLALKVRDRTIFEIADRLLANNDGVIVSEEDGTEFRTMQLPVPLQMEVRATLAMRGDYLFLASHDDLIRQLISVQNGEIPGLKEGEEFQRLAAGMPTEGNSFAFISGRFNETVQNVIGDIIAQEEDENFANFMERFMQSNSAAGFTVGQHLPDGLFSVTTGTQRPEQLVLVPLVAAPAIGASMLLPALAKAKEKAQSVKCMNNMKQIGLAAIIYADEHDNNFPENILETQDYLPVSAVLFCPISPESSSADQLTWETLDIETTSYEYSGQGTTLGTPDAAQTVILRCKFHNHVGHANGSVMAEQ